jgi:hypothetical protein
VPSERRATWLTNKYIAFVTLNGKSLASGQINSTLRNTSESANLSFYVHMTFHQYQYATLVIEIHGKSDKFISEYVGRITIKGVSVRSVTHTEHNGAAAVLKQLQIFSASVTAQDALPRKLLTLEVDCTKVSTSVHNKLADMIARRDKPMAKELDNIRTLLAATTDKKVGITFHVLDRDLPGIVRECNIFNERKSTDQNKKDREYPFSIFFKESPNVQQLTLDNAPIPGMASFPLDHVVPLPAVDTFDTPEEQMVPLIMGGYVELARAFRNMNSLLDHEFKAHAVDLPYWKGESFLLLVESPTEDDIYQPKEGDVCSICLVGVHRQIPKPQGNQGRTADELEKLAADLFDLSVEARAIGDQDDEDSHIRQHIGSHSLPGAVTDERIELLKYKRDEYPDDLKSRIRELIDTWTKEAGLPGDGCARRCSG